MKKIKNIVMILVMMMLLPITNVKAEEAIAKEKEPVNVYIFRSDSCTFCIKTMKFLEESKEEYGKYYEVHDYEVSNSENMALYQEVAEFMGDTFSGSVPYMVVGKYSYPRGFDPTSSVSSTSEQTMGEQLMERIMEIYNSDDRYDVMKALNEKPNYDVVVAVAAGIIVVGLVAVVLISRRQNREN